MFLTRRSFLQSIAGAAGGLLAVPATGRVLNAAERLRTPRVLKLGHVLQATAAGARDDSAALGFMLGIEEAQHAARLFGIVVEHRTDTTAERLIREFGPHVLIGGGTMDSCSRLADTAAAGGTLFLNAGCPADILRGAECRRTTFHITASEAMRRDALAQANVDSEKGDVLVWHESLERYGAGQLNARFRDRFGRGMDSDAWAAWMAVKIAAETFLRAKSDSATGLLGALTHPTARFDGHKGRPLSFRPWDHQLRQPLYVTRRGDPSQEIAEVPARVAGMSAVEQLDQLGASAASSACTWEK